MNTIAIANQKGGCGKTTTAINLAAELGLQDQRVLLIDMDPQGHASMGLGISDRDLPGLYEVFSDEVLLYDAVLSEVVEGVDLVPANITLAAVEPLLTDQPGRERQLLEHIEPLGNLYDYILIDCPPSLGLLSINALRACGQILTPVEASLFALEGIQRLQDIVDLLHEKYRIELSVKVIPTMFDHHTRFAQNILRQIREQLPVDLSGIQIRHTVRAREAAYFGKPLSSYAPHSTARDDYRRLAGEILTISAQPGVTLVQEDACLPEDVDREETSMSQISEKKIQRQMVVLTFSDIDCKRLQLAGDFNGWVPDRDVETRSINGYWQKVFTAEPGVYEYQVLIDGKWQADPTNPCEVPNDIGGINSLLQVPVHH
jgi:chromosome partitioning protein